MNGEFTKEDLEYYKKERPGEFGRYMKVWEVVSVEAKRINCRVNKNEFETNLNVTKISRITDVSIDGVRKRLIEQNSLGAIIYRHVGSGSQTIIRVKDNKQSRYLDRELKKAKEEGLL